MSKTGGGEGQPKEKEEKNGLKGTKTGGPEGQPKEKKELMD